MRRTNLWDRCLIGLLCALIGLVLGGIVALFVGMLVRSGESSRAIVVASALYFFVVGMAKGARAGDFAGEAVGVSATAMAATAGMTEEPKGGSRWGGGTSVWLWSGYGVWVALAAVLS